MAASACLREAEIEAFLTHLAVDRHVAASTLERIDSLRARRKPRLPVVLSPNEVRELLTKWDEYPSIRKTRVELRRHHLHDSSVQRTVSWAIEQLKWTAD